MACPRCQGQFNGGVEECPSCQFSLSLARQSFPFAAPPLDFLVDPTGILPEGAETELQTSYEALRVAFPQVQISLALSNLAPGTSLREFSFWWFNDAPDGTDERLWQILLLVDAQSGALCLTPGYALEPFLLNKSWADALHATAITAQDSGWTEALKSFLRNAHTLLEAEWTKHADPELPVTP